MISFLFKIDFIWFLGKFRFILVDKELKIIEGIYMINNKYRIVLLFFLKYLFFLIWLILLDIFEMFGFFVLNSFV